MTQEEKQLLLKDLCARIPYGVIVELRGTYEDGEKYIRDAEFDGPMLSYLYYDETSIKPYLRPMSSMTEEEKKEYSNAHVLDNCDELANIQKYGNKYIQLARTHAHDYLVSHQFDYRGLIEMGLALEAPEGMYE